MHPRCTGFIRLEADAAWKAANAWTATAQALSAAVAQGVTPAPIALVGGASASEGGA